MSENNTLDFDDLVENPEENGFSKVVSCDRCGSQLFCSPDFDPPGCPCCSPELWNGGPL